jgi:hypothetical protein
MSEAAAIVLSLLALICLIFVLGGLGLLISGKNRRGYVVVGTTTFAVLAAVLTLGSFALW